MPAIGGGGCYPGLKLKKVRKGTHCCTECKRRKIKCDRFDYSPNSLPCQQCRSRNIGSLCKSQVFVAKRHNKLILESLGTTTMATTTTTTTSTSASSSASTGSLERRISLRGNGGGSGGGGGGVPRWRFLQQQQHHEREQEQEEDEGEEEDGDDEGQEEEERQRDKQGHPFTPPQRQESIYIPQQSRFIAEMVHHEEDSDMNSLLLRGYSQQEAASFRILAGMAASSELDH